MINTAWRWSSRLARTRASCTSFCRCCAGAGCGFLVVVAVVAVVVVVDVVVVAVVVVAVAAVAGAATANVAVVAGAAFVVLVRALAAAGLLFRSSMVNGLNPSCCRVQLANQINRELSLLLLWLLLFAVPHFPADCLFICQLIS